MKKSLKIIFALAGTTPLLMVPYAITSCASKGENFTYKFDSTNPAKDFMPEDSLGDIQVKADELTPLFINKMNENKHILADIITYSAINDFFYFDPSIPELDEIEGSVNVTIGQLNAENSRCTFQYSVDFTSGDTNYKATCAFKNVPFSVYQWTENETGNAETYWCFAPVYTMLARPFNAATAQRINIYNSYLKYLDNWSVSGTMFNSYMPEQSISFQAGDESGYLNYYFVLGDTCLYGQSFNKINYLKDIQIQ